MARVSLAGLILSALIASSLATRPARADQPALSWRQEATSLTLLNGTNTVWKLVADPKLPKSFFHPLATLDGQVLTAFEPDDHPWHRGLWWSWKFINDTNYWEEDRKSKRSHGENALIRATLTPREDFSAVADLEFLYRPWGKPAVLTETRRLLVHPPDDQGRYRIDWSTVFTAGEAAVSLSRTPLPREGGPAWGGYAGLSLRLPKGIRGWEFRTPGGAVSEKDSGNAAPWVDFAGPGPGIALFDHPGNLRHPPPWYLSNALSYCGPALLFNQPLQLAPGEKLSLRYRVLVHPAPMNADELAQEWKRFHSPPAP